MIANNPKININDTLKAIPKLTDQDFQRAADSANALLRRTRGAQANSETQSMNEIMRQEPATVERASKVFIRTLQGLCPLGLENKDQKQLFWDIAKTSFTKLKDLIDFKNPFLPTMDDHKAATAITESIKDKTLIQEIQSFEKALKENQIEIDISKLRLLKLVADEPLTVSMRELAADEKKQKDQTKLADPSYKANSGPLKAWHLAALVDLIVAAVQVTRKGLVKGILDPLTIAFTVGSFLPTIFPEQVTKIFDFIQKPFKTKATIKQVPVEAITVENVILDGYKLCSITKFNDETEKLIRKAQEITVAQYLPDKIGDQEFLNKMIENTKNLISKKDKVTPMLIALSADGQVVGSMSPAARLDMFINQENGGGYPPGLIEILKDKVLNQESQYYKSNQPAPNAENTWEIAGIVIAPQHRGKGLASELYDIREQYFKSQGAQYIAYNHNIDNIASQKLADKKGYDHNGADWHFDHRDEGRSVLRMKKLL